MTSRRQGPTNPANLVAMEVPATTDVVVIGAGIAGASAAWTMVQRGLRVLVLEAEPAPGMHATGRSAALLTETYGAPPVIGLVRASRAFIVEPPDGFTDHALTAERGLLWVAREADAAALRAEAATWTAAHDVLDAGGSRDLVGLLRPEACVVGVHEPGAVDLDVVGLLQGFLRGTHAGGGAIVAATPVTGIARRGAGWRVTTPSGPIDAGTVVDAAGAWGDVVAAMAGVGPIGLTPKRRTAFLFNAPAGSARWPIVIDAGGSYYVKPDSGRLLGSPSDATPSEPCDARPDELDVARGVDAIEAALDLEVRSLKNPWAGLRTFCPDSVPAVGADPDHPGFVWLVGKGGYGIKTSPAMAMAATAAVIGEPWPEALTALGATEAALHPRRFR
jgi:D-arginine dehydrogenase